MLSKLARYNKLWMALLGAAVLFAGQYYGVDKQWYQTVVSLLTAAGVYAVPNKQ